MAGLIITIALLALLTIAVAVVKRAFNIVGIWNAIVYTFLLGWDLLVTFMAYRK